MNDLSDLNKDQINTSFFIQQLKQGENSAFETLYHLYFQKLHHFANSYLENEQESEEIVQNVFFKIWEKREKLELSINLHSYLFKMVKNSCLDYFKHQKIREKYQNYCDSERRNINYLALLDESSSDFIEKELLIKINAVVEHKEIAEELNISTKTVENQITKAIKFLRLELKEYTALFL